MSGYVGKVKIGDDISLVGSTLYGICNSQASSATKTVIATDNNSGKFINNNYNQLLQGTTIHVKFVNGNTVTNNLTLQVGTVETAQNIVGNCVCSANTIISFTLDENEDWVVNDNIDTDTTYTFATGTTNGTISVTPAGGTAQSVSVYGLQGSAYKGVITNIGQNTTSEDLPTTSAVVAYVQTQTGGLAGLTGAMHFRGIATQAVTDGGVEDPVITNYDFGTNGANAVGGDVVLWNNQEYVWTETQWELLGDEGSYALKSSIDTITEVASAQTVSVGSASGWNAGGQASLSIAADTNTAASLTEHSVSIPYIENVGSPTTASVSAGILTITPGDTPSFATTPITVKEIGTFTPNVPAQINFTTNTLPQLTVTPTDTSKITTNDTVVVVPNSNNNNNNNSNP